MTDASRADRLVLREDVLLRRAEELPPELCHLLHVSDQDVLIIRPGSRTPSKLLGPPAGELLEEFRHPSTIADAVVRTCSQLKLPLEAVLDGATSFLYHLLGAGFLVRESDADEVNAQGILAPGTSIGSYQVVKLLRLMEDTGIYAMAGPDGAAAVLKAARNLKGEVHHKLRHEASVLETLEGLPAPRLLEAALETERPYLLLELCPGINAALAADELRRQGEASSPYEIVDLCCRVLDAYVSLHDQGVLHGDVHPANILVDRLTGNVRLVDFGLARMLHAGGASGVVERGGNPHFFEPEYARAILAHQPPPPASPAGEQYSLGVVLYRMLTGRHYLPVELEELVLLDRITTSPPLPFSNPVVRQWTSVEKTLQRALAKDRESRFPSVRDMANSLRQARASITTSRRSQSRGRRQGPDLLSTILGQYGRTRQITRGLPPPAASIHFGAAGVAYFFYRASMILHRPELMATADQWLDRAKEATALGTKIYASDLGITPATVGSASLHHGSHGISCVEGLLWCAWGDPNPARVAMCSLTEAVPIDDRLDLTTGSAGLLLGCAILHQSLSLYQIHSAQLTAAADRLCGNMWSLPRPLTQSLVPDAPPFLGIAHGWAGALYATLRWSAATGEQPPPAASKRLEEIATLAVRHQGRACWPWTASGGEFWTGWCHGSAGYVHLWALAYAVTGDDRYFELAREAAEDVWERRHLLGHLCCGSAGQAYSMLALYRLTEDGQWVDRARELLQHALTNLRSPSSRPGSLYAGDVGVALLEADLLQPETAAMPLFAPE